MTGSMWDWLLKAVTAVCASAPLLVLCMLSLVMAETDASAPRKDETPVESRSAPDPDPGASVPDALTKWLEQAAITYQSDVARKLSVPRYAEAEVAVEAEEEPVELPAPGFVDSLRAAVDAALIYVVYWIEQLSRMAGLPPLDLAYSSVTLMADQTARDAKAFVDARRKAEADWKEAVERADEAAAEAARAEAERKSAAEASAAEAERRRAEARKAELKKLKEELDRRIEEGLKRLEELEKLDTTKRTEATRKALAADAAQSAGAALKAVTGAAAARRADAKAAEQQRLAEAKAVEEERRAAEAKAAEEAREAADAEAARKAEEQRLAEAKATEDRRVAQAKAAEEARKAADAAAARKAEEQRVAEAKAAEDRRVAEAKAAEEARKVAEPEAARKVEAQPLAEAKTDEKDRAAEAKAAEVPRTAEPETAKTGRRPPEIASADAEARAEPRSDATRKASETATRPAAETRRPRKLAATDAAPRESARPKKHVRSARKATKTKVYKWRRHADKVHCKRKACARAHGKRVHVVRPGDTLWGIARRYLGKGARYKQISAANRKKIRNPDRIFPCQVLRVPHARH
ncbi:MAG: LysM peptidoglycan-binding domain-containing protein [Hyphomicrobium sp.]|nr:LysM peptidoglycan-binding domain-containing protein [Hyphomicrobium sp.]